MVEKMRNFEIYGLYCICDQCGDAGTIRYVGLTVEGARIRFHKHKYSALNGLGYPVNRWMRKHGVDNTRWTVLQTCSSQKELNEAEPVWIERLGTLVENGGYNLAPGGEGTSGYIHPPDAKTRISRPVSASTRAKISKTLSGRLGEASAAATITRDQAEEVIRLFWEGKTILEVAEITKIKRSTVIGITHVNSWPHIPRPDRPRTIVKTGHFTPGQRPKNTKLTEDLVREIRARGDAGESALDLGCEYGVTSANIRMIVSRRTWKNVH